MFYLNIQQSRREVFFSHVILENWLEIYIFSETVQIKGCCSISLKKAVSWNKNKAYVLKLFLINNTIALELELKFRKQ